LIESLTAEEPEFQAWFGYSGALRDDRLVAAAPFTSSASAHGAIYEFERTGTAFEAASRTADFDQLPEDGSLNAARLPYFGGKGAAVGSYSVALGPDVTIIGVAGTDGAEAGAAMPDSGQVWIFRRNRDGGTSVETLLSPSPQACALFGRSVAARDDLLAVGAPGTSLDGLSSCDLPSEAGSGAVFVYRDDGTAYRFERVLRSDDVQGGAFFGDAVRLASDRLAVGAPFERDGESSGAVYVYRTAPDFLLEDRVANLGARPGSAFGASVDLEGDVLVVGAPLDDACGGAEPVGSGGRAYVYRRTAGRWSRGECLYGSDPMEADLFGWNVALAQGHLVVGAPFDSSGDGAAYLFESDQRRFTCASRLRAPNRTQGTEPVEMFCRGMNRPPVRRK
jgi:hypothetical protein